ncbi:MAG: threonine--tRNA ligase [candidate division Zixibacteria bacterium RBG_16_50_21]|nr:MAG: threonine--tRNA ligase [candidate division Zixibacteria bacterium RBG_16_50_21]
MDKIKVSFPDGKQKEFPRGITLAGIAREVQPEALNEILAAQVNGYVMDLFRPLENDASVQFLTFKERLGKEVLWHSTAHVMAQAVQELFPGTKLAIGPPIEEGFYYDFDKESAFQPEDLSKIEARMKDIIDEDAAFKREEVLAREVKEFFKKRNEDYKVELISDLEQNGDTVSIYKHSRFVDLCRGPHIPSTKKIKAFKLLQIAGAYWRGSEKNQMLQRIYGVSYPSQELLDEFLKRQEEAKRRDHRKLGKELDLFSIQEEAGPGLIFWHPKGAFVRHQIESYMKDLLLKSGYQLVYTPHIAKIDLWRTSGHTEFYRDKMYPTMHLEEAEYQLKPMNCPFHILVYKNKIRSYRDLPIRLAEYGTVYRHERSGVLHGLPRVRGFTQDDAHVFCTPDQVEEEVIKMLDLTKLILNTFGFKEFEVLLSTRPEKFVGEIADWQQAEAVLQRALEKYNWQFTVAAGEGAFYGPKIDILVKDALGRSWQCTTIQFDFNLPHRFDLHYTGSDGKFHRPMMVHRAIFGSMERFFGVLVEHYAGAFPVWLAPVQVMLLPITDSQIDYCNGLKVKLEQAGLRIEIDANNEKINNKIRQAESQKIPYMLVAGKREAESGKVSVRQHGKGDLGVFALEDFVRKISEEAKQKV